MKFKILTASGLILSSITLANAAPSLSNILSVVNTVLTPGKTAPVDPYAGVFLIKQYKVPPVETAQYKIENLTFSVENMGYKKVLHVTGVLYNKTEYPIQMNISVAKYDQKGNIPGYVQQNNTSNIVRIESYATSDRPFEFDRGYPWYDDDYELDIKNIEYKIADKGPFSYKGKKIRV